MSDGVQKLLELAEFCKARGDTHTTVDIPGLIDLCRRVGQLERSLGEMLTAAHPAYITDDHFRMKLIVARGLAMDVLTPAPEGETDEALSHHQKQAGSHEVP